MNNNKILLDMKLILFISYCSFFWMGLSAQSVSGNFSKLGDQKIKLEGFNGMNTFPISENLTDEKGSFSLKYSKSDYGVGYLISSDKKPLLVILSGEDIEITGETLSLPETIIVKIGQENRWFEQYAKAQPRREQALSAWTYLEKIYNSDSLFAVQKTTIKAIQNEKDRIKQEEVDYIETLPKDSYAKWFLPTRKLVSSVSTIAQYRPEEIPETIKTFRKLDYTDTRLYKSGLYRDAVESHYWLLENMGKPLDTVYKEMNFSTDYLINNLIKDEKKFNEITNYLFDLLERHSLFQASEYLALKVLNEESCTVNSDLARQLETYRAMKKGNIAPEIIFEKSNFAKQSNSINKLSEIKSKYTVVVFGGSWCPKCKEELPEIVSLYEKWKSKGVEVIFIGLEDDKKIFTDFTKTFPFPSYSDLKKWDSKIVNDYYVFSTPTIFLLDNKREIILRPNSVKQMDSWVDWYIKSIP